MKERLTDIISKFTFTEYQGKPPLTMEERYKQLAKYLIKNGVLLPPCKIGDTVYRVSKRYGVWCVLPREVVSITHRLDHFYQIVWEIFSTEHDRLGKTVFLTQEEAEKEIERLRAK